MVVCLNWTISWRGRLQLKEILKEEYDFAEV